MGRIRVLEMIDKPFLGGGQRNLLSLAASLDRERFDVSVCSGENGPLVEEVKTLGIPHFPVPFSKRLNRRIFHSIEHILRENRFDIVHTHGGVAGLFGRRAARRCRVPVIIHTLHGIHYLHYRNPVLRLSYILLERWFSRFTDSLILVCSADQKQAHKFRLGSEDRMTVIPNGLDIEEVWKRNLSSVAKSEKKDQLAIPSHHPVLGTVARLHRQKGIPFLIQSMERIATELPDSILVIVGSGPEEESAKELITARGLDDKIIMLGEREDALEILSLFDVFVLPSLWEGLPYVLLEAALMEKPVVATAVDGVLEIIEDGTTGILVPAEDSEKLAEAVLHMVADRVRSQKMARQLKCEVIEKYTLTRMVEQVQDLYSRLSDV